MEHLMLVVGVLYNVLHQMFKKKIIKVLADSHQTNGVYICNL